MALCVQADVEERIQTTFATNPDPTIAALITAAQARIESFVGRKLESTTYTDEVYDPPRYSHPVRLRHWPVTDVTAVSVDGTALTVADDILFYEGGALYKVSDGRETYWNVWKRQSVLVSYVGGYLSPDHDTALELLRDICAWMVAHAYETGKQIAEEAGALVGVRSEQIGDYVVSYASDEGVDLTRRLSISDEFKAELQRFQTLVVA